MKRHLTASPLDRVVHGLHGERTVEADRPTAAFAANDRARTAPGKPRLRLARSQVRTHTLVLAGELNLRSAPTLEADIERLCDEGVGTITLDLRSLDQIDSTGIAVIAFRCELCRKRGHTVAVIPGSSLNRRALERAGVTSLLPAVEEVAPALP